MGFTFLPLFFSIHFSFDANAIIYILRSETLYGPSINSPFKVSVIASTGIRIVILAMHPGGPIVSAIHVPVSIGATRIHPFTVVTLRAISAVVHVLIISASCRIVCGAAVAIIVGRRAVSIIVVYSVVASAIRRRTIARVTVSVACGAIVVCSAVASCVVRVPRGVIGVPGGTVGGTVGIVVGVVRHFLGVYYIR